MNLELVAFGAVDGSLWATVATDGTHTTLLAGTGDAAATVVDGLTWSDAAIDGDGVSLALAELPAVTGDGPGVTGSAADGQRLLRVTGSIAVDGVAHEVACPGVAARTDAAGAVRCVAGWFGDEEGLCLLAVRPGADSALDADAVAASLFEPTGWIAVGDPRLSTTYDGDGAPTRCTLELWVGEGEEEFPRRAAGETDGPAASADAPGPLRVSPLRCHSRGEEGAGVYVLASR